MASIPQYRQRIAAPIAGERRQAHAPDLPISQFNPKTEAIGNVIKAVSAFHNNGFDSEEESGRAWASIALSKARLKWTNALIDAKSEAEPGAPDFQPTLLSKFDEFAAEELATAPTAKARGFYEQRLADLRTTLGESAKLFEAEARITHREDQFNQATETLTQLMQTDSGQYTVALAEQLAIIDSSAMPPAKRAALRQGMIEKVSEAAVWADIQRDPNSFLQSIGFGAPESGKVRKTDGDLSAPTGNLPYDNLPFNKRIQMFEAAIRVKSTVNTDADKLAETERKRLAESSMKEAWARLSDGQLKRDFIESIRPVIDDNDYKALLVGIREGIDGASTKSDGPTFNTLQSLLYRDPRQAEVFAYSSHRNGLLTNGDLASALTKARELQRSEGPKSEYERTRAYIVGSLDPGPFVQDPIGRGRMAEALYTFDAWVESGKAKSDEEIATRGREIITQYRFIDMSQTVAALPQPRSGVIRRNVNDPAGMVNDIAIATVRAGERKNRKELSEEEYASELKILKRWRDAVTQSGDKK